MEFSLLNAVRNHPQSAYAERDVYADYISDAILAEEMGFVRSWYGEHHFRECQWTGAPILVCTAVAARTTTLRVGTAVALLPFHNPIRMAEDVAVCDILSGGRFDFGVGPGSQFEEFRSFGIDPKTMNGRMYESIDWILEAFASKEEFSHKGKYYDIPNMTFTTKPVQDPVPVWSSSMGPKNAARSAERGFNFIGPGNFGYDAALTAAGRNPADYKIASMQVIHVSDSTDKAWDEAAAGIEYFVNFYNMRLDLEGKPQGNEYITEEMIRGGNAGFWSAAVGAPDDVTKALTPFAAGALGRITELACGFRHPGMRNDVVHKSMRLFQEHVQPALAEIAAANGL
jgi:alkanesulfonate monooxygenase SsuD/methylene tetrahydromethanopterin reductase-like flavin-dependent oxidoreductase (luciferase family)